MKRGRKPQMIKELEQAPIIEIACAKVGISRMTHYRWVKGDAKYAAAAEKALLEGQVRISDLAEAQLLNLIQKGNLGAVVYWLRHHKPAYANRLELSGHVEVQQELSDEEKDTVARALALAAFNPSIHERDANHSGDAG